MGKVARIKGDLDDVETLLEIISVLRDVSTNRFFVFAQRKANYERFLNAFLGYFEMLGNIRTDCKLVRNDNPLMDILVVTSESGFMSQLNGRVTYVAFQEFQKYPNSSVICLGKRAVDKCRGMGMNIIQTFSQSETPDRYKLAQALREYLMERIMSGKSGRCMVVYLWAKSFNLLKPKIVKLLPASELSAIEEPSPGSPAAPAESAAAASRKFIVETSVDEIMTGLANIWVHSRLFEIINDMDLTEAAAQAQQLESAIEGLSTERRSLVTSFRKASRDDLNKAMREVFTQSNMAKGKKR
ncbi:MAG: F0F1 ATP synthase subunit gamma [Candidatus Omnitrophica bacterium]|nr:F0F1 ATP synthase subunit gamma [Candidatus Omnitrophota bacterium]